MAPADVELDAPCDIGVVEVGSQASDRIFADDFGLPPVYKWGNANSTRE